MKKLFIAVAVLMLSAVNAQATVYPFITPKPQFFTSSGSPASGYKICIYEAGTSTLKTTYTTSDATVENSSAIILNSRGESATGIYFSGTAKIVLKTPGSDSTCSTGTAVWTADNMTPAIGTTTDAATQWYATGLSPTYVSTSSFSTDGDNTSVFQVGRRIKITDTADTNYGRISASSYSSSLTTVTVQLDSGAIDSGISAVSVGLTTPTNPSVALDSIATGTTAANMISSGSNTWSGAQVVTGTITSSGANSFSGTQTVTGGINSSGTNTWSGAQTVSGASTFSGTISSSNTNTFSGTQNVTGGIVSSGTNTWSGTQAGTLTITGNINSSGTNTFSGTQNVTGAATLSGGLTSSSTTTISGTTIFSGATTISGNINSSGTNTWSGTNTFSNGLVSTGTMTGNATTATIADSLDMTYSSATGTTATTSISSISVTNGDMLFIQSNLTWQAGATEEERVAIQYSGVTGTYLSGDLTGLTQFIDNVSSGSNYARPLFAILLITQTGTLAIGNELTATSPTNIVNSIGYGFLKKQ